MITEASRFSLPTRYISFQLQIAKLTEANDRTATRGALRAAFNVTEDDLDRWVSDARQHDQWNIEVWATGDQFSTFLIKRDEYGAQNLFANLRAKLTDHGAQIAYTRIVDCVNGVDGPYRIHDRTPRHYLEKVNANRTDRTLRHAKHRERMAELKRERDTKALEYLRVKNVENVAEIKTLKDKLIEGAKLLGLILDASGLPRQSPLARRGADYISEYETPKEAAETIRWTWKRNR